MRTEPLPYRERLHPGLGTLLACILVIPAALLVFLPISVPVGVVAAVVFFVGGTTALWFTSPVIEVDDGVLRAGTARIGLEHVGEAVGYTDPEEARAERGVRMDARAFAVFRGWAPQVVRVPVEDAADPTPYWLLSTRRAQDLAAALSAGRAAAKT